MRLARGDFSIFDRAQHSVKASCSVAAAEQFFT
jgi:hypothetical protein